MHLPHSCICLYIGMHSYVWCLEYTVGSLQFTVLFNYESLTNRLDFLSLQALLYILLQENLQHWLTDPKARDQFVIRAGSDTEVLWNDARHLKPDPVYKRAVSENLCPIFCMLHCFVIMLVYKTLGV